MRILFINSYYDPFIFGGTEIILKLLIEAARDSGHEVGVLSFWDKNNTEEYINGILIYRAKIPNIYFPDKVKHSYFKRRIWHILDIYNYTSMKIVLKYIRKFRPDIVSIHNIYGWSSSIWDAVSKSNVPAIQVLHDLYILCPTNMFKNNVVCRKQCLACKFMRIPHKLKSNKLKAVVGVSAFILNKLLSYGYFEDVPIKRVIYNTTDLNMDNIDKDLEPKYINFGFIGRLVPNKGIEVLLKAYLKIKKPNYRLFIAGTGEENYEEYLKSKYKDNSIIFMGRVKQEEFFKKVDVTIVPSIWYEPLGIVVLESFAFGTPVIGSNTGGIPEMINHGKNGLIFNPYSEGDLEEKMLKFEKNILKWREKSEIIKKSARKFLDYDKWVTQWEELYAEVVNLNNLNKL
ncbi:MULTISPECIES: glycosyltransferase family 4 protein [unclassified Thermosipho (in: thermotogales)]|uniref:glycosyltransferase family 4 protein n=1 Tax=unclassified Thermosipho (in: thermotogales) TaxID=2676525 RepID=UPI0018CC0AAE|nr:MULTISPECIES: glycosyltransferase family 4 protein [unclassified Thermosipho (in: thermotogales)]MBT1247044.1 hypothetical protein [Thermosipho sp. 1244]